MKGTLLICARDAILLLGNIERLKSLAFGCKIGFYLYYKETEKYSDRLVGFYKSNARNFESEIDRYFFDFNEINCIALGKNSNAKLISPFFKEDTENKSIRESGIELLKRAENAENSLAEAKKRIEELESDREELWAQISDMTMIFENIMEHKEQSCAANTAKGNKVDRMATAFSAVKGYHAFRQWYDALTEDSQQKKYGVSEDEWTRYFKDGGELADGLNRDTLRELRKALQALGIKIWDSRGARPSS